MEGNDGVGGRTVGGGRQTNISSQHYRSQTFLLLFPLRLSSSSASFTSVHPARRYPHGMVSTSAWPSATFLQREVLLRSAPVCREGGVTRWRWEGSSGRPPSLGRSCAGYVWASGRLFVREGGWAIVQDARVNRWTLNPRPATAYVILLDALQICAHDPLRTNRRKDGRTEGLTERTNGQTDRRTDGRTDGRMD